MSDRARGAWTRVVWFGVCLIQSGLSSLTQLSFLYQIPELFPYQLVGICTLYTIQWWPQRKTDCQGLLPILADSAEGSFKSLFLVAIKCFVSTFHAL